MRENTHVAQLLRRSPDLRQWMTPMHRPRDRPRGTHVPAATMTPAGLLNAWEATLTLETVHLGTGHTPAADGAPTVQ